MYWQVHLTEEMRGSSLYAMHVDTTLIHTTLHSKDNSGMR